MRAGRRAYGGLGRCAKVCMQREAALRDRGGYGEEHGGLYDEHRDQSEGDGATELVVDFGGTERG